MARILMVTSEASPFAKTGGLGDVLGALPAAWRVAAKRSLWSCRVIAPRTFPLPIASGMNCRSPSARTVFSPPSTSASITASVTFLSIVLRSIDRNGIYGEFGGSYADNHIRFAF